jgi:hypothetical protein
MPGKSRPLTIVFTEGYNMIEACAITAGIKIPFFFTGKRLIYQRDNLFWVQGLIYRSRLNVEDELRHIRTEISSLLFDSNPAPMWMIARDDLVNYCR